MKKHKTFDNQKRIMLVLMFMALSIGLWSNFRQIWLQDNFFDIDVISKIISLGMFGSCFLAIIISLFSTKVRIKEVLTLTFSISIVSMIGLMFSYKSLNKTLIETFMLLTIITENLFWIGIYPLFTTIKKSDKIYEKKVIIQNMFKDFGILIGGIVIGKSLFGFSLNANFCLLLSIVFSMISLYFLLSIRYEEDKENKLETKDFVKAFKIVFKNKIFIFYFIYSFLSNAAWDIIVGLQIILFTSGFNLPESKTSYIILGLGMISTALAIVFAKKVKFKSNFSVCIIKYLSRILLYLLVYITGNIIIALIAFAVTIITSRMGSNYTDAVYLNLGEEDLQLMLSNMKFFMVCLGETVGIYLAGHLFKYGIGMMFLASSIIYLFTLICCYILSRLYNKSK